LVQTSDIKLPELGENLEEGEVLDVKVSEGDTVKEGQTLLEIEAEKSTVEVPSPVAGRVAKLLVKKGDQVKVNQVICRIEGGAEKNGGPQTASVRQEAKAVEPEPKKAAVTPEEEPAEHAQHVIEQLAAEPPPPEAAPAGDGQGAAPTRTLVPAGPATRRLARELGVDLGRVAGSAPRGRVTQEDVKAYVRKLASSPSGGGARPQAPPLPDFERWGPVERQPLDSVRRRTADQVSLAWSLVPHVTQQDVADITELDAFRRQQDGQGPKLTVTAFVLKAVAALLKQFPRFNASLDSASSQLILKRYYHLGVAVDTDRGLLVPVLRDVDRKSIFQLAQELADVADRARNKKVSAEAMRGGTFTITNLGGIGGTGFSPIVNYPEVAILGLSRARLQPVVRNGQVAPRLLLPLSLSYDHRVIDGADAARFARRLADMLENPMLMLLHA
jgi:pyruvate dehydrogenase E2 component (dihydrolipoyllysine-residue acetyltransferase)